MSKTEWKECTLGDLIRIKHGYAFKGDYITTNDNGVVLVTPGNFAIGGGFQERKCKFFSSDYPNDYVLKAGDLIVTMTDLSKDGDTLGYSAKVPSSENRVYLHNQRIGLIELKNKNVDPNFLYWVMRSPSYQKGIVATASGSTVKHTSPGRICESKILLPPLAEQQRIAKILSSLDDKIELNNVINRNLAEQAQIIFKSYEMKKPFKEMKIGDVADINPDSYGTKDNWDFVNYLDTSNITQNVISDLQYIDLKEESLPSRAKRKVVLNDIIYSTVRPNQLHYGIINDLKTNMLVSTGFAVIRTNNTLVSNEYIYLNLTQKDTIKKLQQIAEQSVSTFPAIKPSDIGNCIIKIFEKNDAQILNGQLSAIFGKILQNNRENKCLANIRDGLLSKLMSGELNTADMVI